MGRGRNAGVLRAALLLPLLGLAPGCVTMGVWGLAGEVDEPSGSASLQRARLDGQSLELIVDFPDRGPHFVRVDLAAATLGFYEGNPTFQGEVLDPRETDLPPEILDQEEQVDLGEAAWGVETSNEEPGVSQSPRLYWSSFGQTGLVLCLRREGQEAIYVKIPEDDSVGLVPLAYVGAACVTPLTFAIDVVTFPFQLVFMLVLFDAIGDIFD